MNGAAVPDLDLSAYLTRIGYDGKLDPEPRSIQRQHTAAIPFENLDPLMGLPVSLGLSSIEGKLVHRA